MFGKFANVPALHSVFIVDEYSANENIGQKMSVNNNIEDRRKKQDKNQCILTQTIGVTSW